MSGSFDGQEIGDGFKTKELKETINSMESKKAHYMG